MDSNYEKYSTLFELLTELTKDGPKKIIIFCTTKRGVDQLERNMNGDPQIKQNLLLEAKGIHGDKVQYERDGIFKVFKKPMDEFYD